jgi:hypothetical protein
LTSSRDLSKGSKALYFAHSTITSWSSIFFHLHLKETNIRPNDVRTDKPNPVIGTKAGQKRTIFFYLCIVHFIMLIFFYQQMHFNLTYKILKFTLKHFFTVTPYIFRSVRTIIRESILSLAKVTFL